MTLIQMNQLHQYKNKKNKRKGLILLLEDLNLCIKENKAGISMLYLFQLLMRKYTLQ
jgi:hypothetical protein